MAKKLEISHASQILTSDSQIVVLSNSYLITLYNKNLKKKDFFYLVLSASLVSLVLRKFTYLAIKETSLESCQYNSIHLNIS